MTPLEDLGKNVVSGCENSIEASRKFIDETLAYPDRRIRQAAAVADGIVCGGIKAIPDRIVNHPEQTLYTAAGGLVVAGVMGAAAAIECPIAAAGVAIGATALTGKYVFDLASNLAGDRKLTGALNNIWNSSSSTKFRSALPAIEERLGAEMFDLALLGATGCFGFKGGNALMKGALKPPALPALADAPSSGAISCAGRPLQAEGKLGEKNLMAMEGWRDRSGFIRYDRQPESAFAHVIERPLSERLDHLENLIKNGKAGQAYDFVNANLSWYKEHSHIGGKLEEISKGFLYVGMNLWSVVHEGSGKHRDTALVRIKEMRQKYCLENTDWPLKISSKEVRCSERIAALSDKQRVSEIDKLFQAGYTNDALSIANWGYIIHRDAGSTTLENRYDLVLYELSKISLCHKEASKKICQERLAELKKAVGL